MSARLPPLNALKAFEATGRHLSVKRAAEELSVTPGAVSQMIRTLERHLGLALFVRVTRGLHLTPAGRDYLPPVRNALRQIAEATRRVVGARDAGLLAVSATPFFAASWLIPRMAGFHARHPDIDLRIVTSHALVDFERDAVDVAVRHGLGRYPGLRSDRVVSVEMVAVAAPSAVARHGRPATAAALLAWPKVHDAERQGWSLWYQAHGIDDGAPARGPSFDDSGLLLKAILAGQGAGLLPAAMIEGELARGQLVRLHDAARLEAFAYYLVCPEPDQHLPKVAAFRDWMLAEAGQAEGRAAAAAKRRGPRKGAAIGSTPLPTPAGRARRISSRRS